MPATRRSSVCAALLAALLAGCGDTSSEASAGMTLADSAGVRVVTWPAGPRDTVRVDQEVLTLGHEGDTLYQFTSVAAVEPLSDGRIVVADRGVNEIRYYGSDGIWLATVGGRGEGPSEIGFLSVVQRWRGDTIVVVDSRNRRLAFFSPEPAFVRTVPWPGDPGAMPEGAGICFGPGASGLTAGPRLVQMGWGCIFSEGGEGIRMFTTTFRTTGLEEELPSEPIGPLAVARAWERQTDEPRMMFPSIPLSGPFAHDAFGEGMVVADLEAFRIDHYGPEGRLRMRIRDEMPHRAVTAEMEAEYLENLHETLRPAAEGVPMPDSLPGFNRLVASGDGIWARHVHVPSDSLVVWSGYSIDGAEVRRFAFPSAFELSAVAGELAYGTITDELDVQRIRVYRLPEGR